MQIYIGADHRGFDLKQEVLKNLPTIIDIGCFNSSTCDYPDIVLELSKKEFDFGILICHSGIGMSVCANKYPKIRAGLCLNIEMAKLSREHTNCNVLVLPSAFLDCKLASSIVKVFIKTQFIGGIYKNRIEKFPSLLKI